MEQHQKKLLEDGDKVFKDRQQLESFWQDIALNFYPEMAEFTAPRTLGSEFADHLTTSYPLLARRSLGDAFSSLLRPVNLDTTSPGVWFSIRAEEGLREDTTSRKWLEWATGIMRRAMYDQSAHFVRATKEGDHIFATFGNAPLSVELNRRGDGLLYRCWHLRDVTWTENSEGDINCVWRKWKPTATQLMDTFGRKVHEKVGRLLKESPYQTVECRHIVVDSNLYETRGGKKNKTPYVSLWIDVENQKVMEETGSWSKRYIIPRWLTIPGSQYAVSPAVTAALPDARLLQAMTLTLLEASEKFANPPVVATQEAIRSDVNLLPGGLTWIDSEYDERMGDALRPLYQPAAGQGLNSALAMRADVREMLAKAFFLDTLSLPPATTKEMTAFEVGERISEWIRRSMPIFEPIEFEYNAPLCEETFGLLLRNGAFGPRSDIPRELSGANIQFKFESPIHESADRKKGQKFLEAKAALIQAAELDPSVMPMIDARRTLRDVLAAIGTPAKWTREDSEMQELEQAQAEQQQMQQVLAGGAAGAEIAKNLGGAAKDFASAAAQPAI